MGGPWGCRNENAMGSVSPESTCSAGERVMREDDDASPGYLGPSETEFASIRGGVPVLSRRSRKPARARDMLRDSVLGSTSSLGKGSMRPACRRSLPSRMVAERNVPVQSTTCSQGSRSPEARSTPVMRPRALSPVASRSHCTSTPCT